MEGINSHQRLGKARSIFDPRLMLATCVILWVGGITVSAQEFELLKPGVPIIGKLAGDEVHLYRLTPLPRQEARVTVLQEGRDLVVSLRSSNETHLTVDNPIGKRGPEWLFFKQESTSDLRLQIKPRNKGVAEAPYTLRLDLMGDETPSIEVKGQRAFSLASARYFAKDFEGALNHLETALPLWQKHEHPTNRAMALFSIGRCYGHLKQWPQAIDSYRSSAKLWQAIGDPFETAHTWNNMAYALRSLGKHREALPLYQRALALFRETPDLSWRASVSTSLGQVLDGLGEPDAADEAYREAQETYQLAGDNRRQAFLLNNRGALARRLGERQAALTYYHQALSLTRKTGSQRWEARILNNMGYVYLDLGQLEKAVSLFDQSLTIRRLVGDQRGEAITLNNLGGSHRRLGQFQLAIEMHEKALEIRKTIGDQTGEARTYDLLGRAYLKAVQPNSALEYFQKALPTLDDLGDRRAAANTRTHLGETYLAMQRLKQAETILVLALSQHQSMRNPAMQTETLLHLAKAQAALGRQADARRSLEDAVAIVESQRAKIGSSDLRASWFATQQEVYEQLIDLLMVNHETDQTGHFAKQALAIYERARGRGLLDLLDESGAPLATGIDPEWAQQRRKLVSKLEFKARAQLKLLSRKHEAEAAQKVENAVQKASIALDEMDTRIASGNAQYASIRRFKPINAEAIRKELDKDTLLLIYALGENQSFLWAVSQDGLTSHTLPGRAMIEKSVLEVYRRMASVDPRDREKENEAAATISRMLLGPVAQQLEDKRLAIVADEVLHYLPFGALPEPQEGNLKLIRPKPLLVKHPLVMLPSASILAAGRGRDSQSKNQKRVLVIADPVLSATDPRLNNRVTPTPTEAPTMPHRSLAENSLSLERLPYTQAEAEAIAAIVGERNGRIATGFHATKEGLLTAKLNTYDYLHFATHGLLNEAHPELSALVLSLFDHQGQPIQGFLMLADIFSLQLSAELVVLSGCQTGLGKEVRGAGIMGPAQGFLHAGSKAVVASLWRVEDKATAQLMARFYRAMLVDRITPIAALREAQLSLWQERRYRDPWFWAAFRVHAKSW